MTIAKRTVKAGGYVGPARRASDIRGFVVHMAEGNNVAAYLSHSPARNVSVQYVVEADGEVVAMVPERLVAGSLNPAALRISDAAYYGRSHLDYVLGDGVHNANHYVIAVEVAGKAKDGPNAKQVASLVRLFNDCRKRFPRIKPIGHADQQAVKPCPGGTGAMKLAFKAMGGHGKDYKVPKPKPVVPPPVVDPDCATALAAANAHSAELQGQLEAMQAAVDAAIAALAAVDGTP